MSPRLHIIGGCPTVMEEGFSVQFVIRLRGGRATFQRIGNPTMAHEGPIRISIAVSMP